MKERNIFIDVIKGIAIILVVFGHCIQCGTALCENRSFFDSPIFMAIYSFHMPLFMIISGYLFYFSINKYSTISNIKKRFTNILLPLFIWHTIYIVIYNLPDFINGTTIDWIAKIRSYLFAFWFLWAVFWSSIIVLLINKYFNDKIWIYLIICIMALFVPIFPLYIYMLPYFIVGFLWNKFKLSNKILQSKQYNLCLIGLLAIWTLLYFNFTTNDYIYTSGICIVKKVHDHYTISYSQIHTDLYRYFIGFVGSACVLMLIYKILLHIRRKNIFILSLSNIGKRSIGIYIISSFFNFNLKYLPNVESYGYFEAIIETICIVCMTYYFTVFIGRYSFSRKFLLGGR